MSKNKTRLIVVIIALITIISTFCYAETDTNQTNNTNVETPSEAVTTAYDDTSPGANARTTTDESTPVTTAETEEEVTIEEEHDHTHDTESSSSYIDQEILEDDLYLFGSDVTMNKLVDGNVFIFGNNVKIIGQTSGNIFVFGNDVTFSEAAIYSSAFIFGNNVTFDKAVVQHSVFIFGNNVTFNGVSNSLYCLSQDLTIEQQFGVYRDIHAACNNFDFDGIIGRDGFLTTNNLRLHENALVYGNFNYTTGSEILIPDGIVAGDITFTESQGPSLLSYIANLAQILVFTIITFFAIKIFTKNPESKECSALSHPFKTFGIGILSIIVILALFLLLLISRVGLTSSMAVLSVFSIMMSFSVIVLPIYLAKHICINKKHRGIKEFFLTVLLTIITWGLSLIPYAGIIFTLILVVFGFGIIVYTPLLKKSNCKNKNKNKKVETKNVETKKEETTEETKVEDSKKTDDTNSDENNQTNDK